MRTVKYIAITLFLAVSAVSAYGQTTLQGSSSAFLDELQTRIAAYSQRRAEIAATVPALPEQATKEQIEAHKMAFQRAMLAARSGARRGDILTPGAAAAIRKIISDKYTGEERRQLRQQLFVAENKTVPVRANATYPEAAEILEMPPALLLALPQLPKELRWRFVANNLLLMDSDLLLITDYMTKALPK